MKIERNNQKNKKPKTQKYLTIKHNTLINLPRKFLYTLIKRDNTGATNKKHFFSFFTTSEHPNQ